MADRRKPEVAVIGGGVIGTSIAYQLAKKGVEVTLLEKGLLGGGASNAAAGMLGAQVESDFPGPMVELCLESRRMFPALSRELKERTGLDIEWNGSGLLRLAGDSEEANQLEERGRWQRERGERAEWWNRETLRRREPDLDSSLVGGLYIPDDSQVSAPRLVQAFSQGATLLGAELLEGVEVQGGVVDRGRVLELTTSIGRFSPGSVVLAAGAWAGFLAGELGLDLPVVSVKGESLAVRPTRPLFDRTLFGNGCYLVPKADGRVIIGATEIRQDFTPGVSGEAIQTLLAEAFRLVPELREAEWLRSWSGVRPGTVDGLPYLGAAPGFTNLWIAGGHFRNGILLSAVTGKGMADLITENPVTTFTPFSPERVMVSMKGG